MPATDCAFHKQNQKTLPDKVKYVSESYFACLSASVPATDCVINMQNQQTMILMLFSSKHCKPTDFELSAQRSGIRRMRLNYALFKGLTMSCSLLGIKPGCCFTFYIPNTCTTCLIPAKPIHTIQDCLPQQSSKRTASVYLT